MKFYEEPFGFLIAGRHIRRAAWPAEMWLNLHPDGSILQNNTHYWASQVADFLATDWEVEGYGT